MRLQRIGAQEERPAAAQLELRYLELGTLAGHYRPVLAPVELERLARRKHQRHKGAAPRGPCQLLLRPSPRPGKGRHPVIRALETQGRQIRIQPPQVAALLAPFARFRHKPRGQLRRKPVELARTLAPRVLRLDHRARQILPNRVARQLGASRNLPNRYPIPQMPAPDYTEYRHVDHSFSRSALRAGQLSIRGSNLNANHPLKWVSFQQINTGTWLRFRRQILLHGGYTRRRRLSTDLRPSRLGSMSRLPIPFDPVLVVVLPFPDLEYIGVLL